MRLGTRHILGRWYRAAQLPKRVWISRVLAKVFHVGDQSRLMDPVKRAETGAANSSPQRRRLHATVLDVECCTFIHKSFPQIDQYSCLLEIRMLLLLRSRHSVYARWWCIRECWSQVKIHWFTQCFDPGPGRGPEFHGERRKREEGRERERDLSAKLGGPALLIDDSSS